MAHNVRGYDAATGTIYAYEWEFGNWHTSTDGGDTWTDEGYQPQSQLGSPPQHVIAAGSYMFCLDTLGKLWRATKGDFSSWTDITPTTLVSQDRGRPNGIAHNGSVLLWSNYNNSSVNNGRIFRSTDDGATWSEVLPYATSQARHFHWIGFDPNDATQAFAVAGDSGQSGKGLWRSTDSGATWSQVSSNEYGVNAVIEDNRVILGNDGPDQTFDVGQWRRGGSSGATAELIGQVGYEGSERGLHKTAEGNLFWFTDGESGAISDAYAAWIAYPPFGEYRPVLLESFGSSFGDGPVVEHGDYLFYRLWRITRPKFTGQT